LQRKNAKPPRGIEFSKIKDAVLGKQYELSLVFVDSRTSRRLNRTYRGKDKPTNILSFPLSKTHGEILIDLNRSKHEAPAFDMNFKNFVQFLFIHGLLHLKGMEHGSTMEKAERKFLKIFNIHGSIHYRRH
jgi:probable rRNA maturation factor